MDTLIQRILDDATKAGHAGAHRIAMARLALALDLGGADEIVMERAEEVQQMGVRGELAEQEEIPVGDQIVLARTAVDPEIFQRRHVEPSVGTKSSGVAIATGGGLASSRPEERSWDRTLSAQPLEGADEVLRSSGYTPERSRGRAQKGRSGIGVLVLVLVLAVGFLGFTEPGRALWGRLDVLVTHPVDKAQAALVVGDTAQAAQLASQALGQALDRPDRLRARMILAEALISSKPDSALSMTHQLLSEGGSWDQLMKLARLFSRLHRVNDAADAYLAAFRAGASGEASGEIERGLRAAGLTTEADRVRQASGL